MVILFGKKVLHPGLRQMQKTLAELYSAISLNVQILSDAYLSLLELNKLCIQVSSLQWLPIYSYSKIGPCMFGPPYARNLIMKFITWRYTSSASKVLETSLAPNSVLQNFILLSWFSFYLSRFPRGQTFHRSQDWSHRPWIFRMQFTNWHNMSPGTFRRAHFSTSTIEKEPIAFSSLSITGSS